MVYTLAPDGKLFDVEQHFRAPISGKVAIFFSGGMESTLLSRMYPELFGNEKILFFYSDSIYCKDHTVQKYVIHRNVDTTAAFLGIDPIYVDVPYSTFVNNKIKYYNDVALLLKEKYDVEFMVYGFTKLLFDLEPIKRLTSRTSDHIRSLCSGNDKFSDLSEQLHLYCDDYMHILTEDNADPILYDAVKNDRISTRFFITPLETLNKWEVVDLYKQRNELEILAHTSSCTNKHRKNFDIHCGACFNCQQRHDAYDRAGIEDPTPYNSSLVKERRQRQKKFYEKHL